MDELTGRIIGAAIEVHSRLGPGLLESMYEDCMAAEFEERGIPYRRQVPIPVTYRGRRIARTLRLDLLVDERVVVEVKTVDALADVHTAQLLTYLRLTGLDRGLIVNFKVARLIEGVKRVVNNY